MPRREQWVPWMDAFDERILSYFGQLGQGFEDISPAENPSGIHLHIVVREGSFDKSMSTLSRRLNRLTERGFLTTVREKENYYYLTGKGQRYLDQELEADEIQGDAPQVD